MELGIVYTVNADPGSVIGWVLGVTCAPLHLDQKNRWTRTIIGARKESSCGSKSIHDKLICQVSFGVSGVNLRRCLALAEPHGTK